MARLIVLDIGNTLTKLGWFEDDWLMETDTLNTQHDILQQSATAQNAMLETLAKTDGLDGMVVSSVVPQAQQWFQNFPHALQQKTLWLDRTQYDTLQLNKLNIQYYQPQALGSDRLANLAAALDEYPNQHVVVCSFGTTATLDLVDPEGMYIGGAILPGARKFQSLLSSEHAAQLFETDVFTAPAITPGLSTEAAIATGLYYGYKGAVLEVLGNMLQQAGWPASKTTFVFTGGDAKAVQSMVQTEIQNAHVNSTLTLVGLKLLWQWQQQGTHTDPVVLGQAH